MKLKLINFIKENSNWRELLQVEPYSLVIKESGDYALFTYSKIGSDFSIPIVQECRGTIINVNMLTPVCVPFFKFFNVQESNAHEIDWDRARVLEKLDGSIIKLWFDNGWRVSTNGTIDARDATLMESVSVLDFYKHLETYYDLFMYAVRHLDWGYVLSTLDTDNTYMFELVSPFNRIVVPHTETKLYHIGTRNNKTLKELEYDIPEFDKPKQYAMGTLDECLDSALSLPFDEEGYVVVDKDYNRVKIKSKDYVIAHHIRGESVVTKKRIVAMILQSGQDDFLSYYPEYKPMFDEVEQKINSFIYNIAKEEMSMPESFDNKKDYAEWAKTTSNPSYFFGLFDGHWENVAQWFYSLRPDKVLYMIYGNKE